MGIVTMQKWLKQIQRSEGNYGKKKKYELSPHYVATHSINPNLYKYVSEKLGKFNPIVSKRLNWTAFHIAAVKGLSEICSYIIQNTSDKNPVANKNHWTPLHLAIHNGHLDTFKLIMEYG